MSHIYKLIQNCIGVGTNEKKERLAQYKNDCTINHNVQTLFHLMLCPSIIYNIKKVPPYMGVDSNVLDTDYLLINAIEVLLEDDPRGKALKERVICIHRHSTHEIREVFEWILARKNPAKIGKTLVNTVWSDTVRTQMYMGALPGTDKALKRLFNTCPIVHSQVKEDGMCLLVDYIDGIPTIGRTRAGNDIGKYFPKFMSRLKRLNVYSGMVHHELFCTDMDRQTGNGRISKQVKNGTVGGDVDNCLHSVLLDPYDINLTQQIRYTHLTDLETEYSKRVSQIAVQNIESAKDVAKQIIKAGGEGSINKDPNGIFKNGKHWNNIKIKNEFPVDLICAGYKPHTQDPTLIGSLLMRTSDNKLEVYVNARCDTDRALHFDDMYQGEIFRVRCESVIQSKSKKKASLYLGRFDGKRYSEYHVFDKTIADTYQEVLDQEAMSKGLL